MVGALGVSAMSCTPSGACTVDADCKAGAVRQGGVCVKPTTGSGGADGGAGLLCSTMANGKSVCIQQKDAGFDPKHKAPIVPARRQSAPGGQAST